MKLRIDLFDAVVVNRNFFAGDRIGLLSVALATTPTSTPPELVFSGRCTRLGKDHVASARLREERLAISSVRQLECGHEDVSPYSVQS